VTGASGLVVTPVRTRGELRRFVRIPFALYKDHPHWVPPLILDRMAFFDLRKNPFYETAEVALFIAWRDGRPVGRIAACVNHDYNEFHDEKTGTFGFFECTRDFEAANALFDTAAEWLRAREQVRIMGPFSFSTNHEVGFLIEGFDRPPAVMMTYTHPYYTELAEAWGFAKAKDLLAYRIERDSPPAERIRRIAARLKARDQVTVRNLDMGQFDAEIERVRRIYNQAWSKNWGFVPLREEEFAHIARDLKLLLQPELAFIAEVAGRPVGFCLALPNVYEVQLKIKNGRLFPAGLLRLLWALKVKKSITSIRMITMGVVHDFQKRGIETVFYVETFDRAAAMGYQWGEISWILEDNELMVRAAEALGSKHYKTYRIYDKAL
jgi:GNAT superfamily N-acetyltransferase